jgi:hypothetical protein
MPQGDATALADIEQVKAQASAHLIRQQQVKEEENRDFTREEVMEVEVRLI